MPASPTASLLAFAGLQFQRQTRIAGGAPQADLALDQNVSKRRTDADLVNLRWEAGPTPVATTTATTYTLDNLTQYDIDGDSMGTVSFAGINALFVENLSDSNDLQLTTDGTNTWNTGPFAGGSSTQLDVQPGGFYCLGGGSTNWSVPASAELKVASSSGTAPYRLGIVGS